MYHKFGVDKYPTTSVKLEDFTKHLKIFTNENNNVLPVSTIINSIIDNKKLPNNTIGITIDDADRSFLKVWPNIKKLGLHVTMFVSTEPVDSNNKNYLNWDEIRQLRKEGVTIGAHSHQHPKYTELSLEEVKIDIEKANKRFLSELGELPTFFAYPYGQASNQIIRQIQDYKYKFAFGQHSGVINETSNLFYLPRFSINENYSDIDRLNFIINSKGLRVYDFVPSDPAVFENPPYIGFSLYDKKLAPSVDCFIFDQKGKIEREIYKFDERIEIRLQRELNGRTRINCTAKDKENNWKWFGIQLISEN